MLHRIALSLLIPLFTISACKGKESKTDPPPTAAKQGESKSTDESDKNTDGPSEADDLPRAPLPSDLDAPLALDKSVVQGQLDYGLTYYILKHGYPEKRAEFCMSINAGSFHEGDDQRGLAHFLEHMAFNGTTSFPKNELIASPAGLPK